MNPNVYLRALFFLAVSFCVYAIKELDMLGWLMFFVLHWTFLVVLLRKGNQNQENLERVKTNFLLIGVFIAAIGLLALIILFSSMGQLFAFIPLIIFVAICYLYVLISIFSILFLIKDLFSRVNVRFIGSTKAVKLISFILLPLGIWTLNINEEVVTFKMNDIN